MRSLNLLGNRFGECVDVCEACQRACVHLWHGLLPDCLPECPVHAPVTHLLTAAHTHTHLDTLVGLAPGQDKLQLSGLRICDQWMRVIAWELQRHQWVTSVDLNSNYFSPRGVRTLAAALRQNAGLQSLYLPRFAYLNRLGPARDYHVPVSLAVTYLDGEITAGRHRSLLFRLTLARLVRRLRFLGAPALRAMLEFLLGAEAQLLILRYLRYRNSPLPR